MARDLARGMLRRYPRLRSSWPLQQASAWRQRQARRAHPRRMASWYRDSVDMHTRLFVSNLEVPEAPQLCEPTSVLITLLDQDGRSLATKRFEIARNASLVLELGDLLPVYLAVTNLDSQPYTSDVTLKDDEGHALHTEVDLPPNGSRFLTLDGLFQNPRGFLHDQPGVLYFGNNRQPAMYYYFVQNQRLGTWRAQHL